MRKTSPYKPISKGNLYPAKPTIRYCCEAMSKAHEGGTDNEGYAELVLYEDGKPYLGMDLPEMNFCPWCGSPAVKPVFLECEQCGRKFEKRTRAISNTKYCGTRCRVAAHRARQKGDS